MKAQEEMVMSEELHLEVVRCQIEYDEQDSVNHNTKLHKTSESLNRKICELKVIIVNFNVRFVLFQFLYNYKISIIFLSI